METFIPGAQVPYMPKEKVMLMRAGLALYECRTRNVEYFNKYLMGPYNAVAHDFSVPGMPPEVRPAWDTRTGIIFDADPDGNCIAFMPDDPWWHNRLCLQDNKNLIPIARHSPREGIVSPEIIRIEQEILLKHLRHDRQVVCVFEDGVEKDYFDNQDLAQKFIEDKRRMVLKTTGEGKLESVNTNRKRYETRPGVVNDYRPEIKQLIKAFGGLTYGWTSCEAFMHDYRPKITKEILEARGQRRKLVQGAELSPDEVMESMRKAPPEKLAEFRKLLFGDTGAPGTKPAAEAGPEPDPPTPPDPKDVVTYTAEGLNKKKVGEIKTLAQALNVWQPEMKKDEMIEAILNKQKGESIEV